MMVMRVGRLNNKEFQVIFLRMFTLLKEDSNELLNEF